MKQIDCVFKVRGVRCSSRKVGERVQWLYMQYKAINVCTDWIDLDSRRHKPHTKKKNEMVKKKESWGYGNDEKRLL